MYLPVWPVPHPFSALGTEGTPHFVIHQVYSPGKKETPLGLHTGITVCKQLLNGLCLITIKLTFSYFSLLSIAVQKRGKDRGKRAQNTQANLLKFIILSGQKTQIL